ncbi:MAG: malto-oligosyltrehalose synthase [Polyangiaceae bacterium]
MRTPRSTYRLQLHPGFGFRDAAEVTEYVRRLGVSELYLSPVFTAAPGSTHGYDVLDHDSLNPELGGESAFRDLRASAEATGLGLTVDFVPNHMGVGCSGNRFWDDVLQYGQASHFADYFDIDWQSPRAGLFGKVLLPILPDSYGACLEGGKIRIVSDGQALALLVCDRKLPLRPVSLPPLFERLAELVERTFPSASRGLRGIGQALGALVEPLTEDQRFVYRDATRSALERFASLVSETGVQAELTRALDQLNGQQAVAESFDFLDELLRHQAYRLSSWRLAWEGLNYRRFFNVNELAAIRVERPETFHAVHAKLLALVKDGTITGIRLDHIDGLYDPIGYLTQLNDALREATQTRADEAPLHVTVEKILAPDEALPEAFVAHGTTGYEFIRVLNGVLVDRRSEASLSSLYRRFTGDLRDFSDHLREAKHQVLDSLLAADASLLSHALERIAERDRFSRDLGWRSLHRALVETMVAFPAYRSYVRPDGTRTAVDEKLIGRAVIEAMARNPTTARAPYRFLHSLLLLQVKDPEAVGFAMRFQQTGGPVTAKSLEDTAFYRYTRFAAENEVGNQPERIGVELQEFHAQNAERASRHPLGLVASSTHDTKRGEDARARLAVLAEMPNTWRRVVFDLHGIAAGLRDSHDAPSKSDEYLYFQTLVGVVPFGAQDADIRALEERLQEYMRKACREAKVRTSWAHPNEDYEAATRRFLSATLAAPAFVERLRRFCARIDPYAVSKSLAQVALKHCAPGVPDTYQGSEVWHQVLVDPDNRRPVDYSALNALLRGIDERRADRAGLVAQLLNDFSTGAVKLFVVSELLRLRNAQPDVFSSSYLPLDGGSDCVAFGRGNGRCELICAVARFPFRLTRGRSPWAIGSVWGEAEIHGPGLAGQYRNVLTNSVATFGNDVRLAEAFRDFPVAIWVRMNPDAEA